MCMMVYVGSESPISLIPWNKDQPALCVERLDEYNHAVVCQFSKPYVYYVGSHEGCGCGFQHSPYEPEEDDDKEEERLVDRSCQQLRALIERLLETQAVVELFACWAGNEAKEPESQQELAPETLTTSHTAFCEEGELIRFSR